MTKRQKNQALFGAPKGAVYLALAIDEFESRPERFMQRTWGITSNGKPAALLRAIVGKCRNDDMAA